MEAWDWCVQINVTNEKLKKNHIYSVASMSGPCGQGCPADRVKDVLSRLPAVSQKFAKYWICRARLMEQEGNLDVLPMFEEAVRVVLEVRSIFHSHWKKAVMFE